VIDKATPVLFSKQLSSSGFLILYISISTPHRLVHFRPPAKGSLVLVYTSEILLSAYLFPICSISLSSDKSIVERLTHSLDNPCQRINNVNSHLSQLHVRLLFIYKSSFLSFKYYIAYCLAFAVRQASCL